MNAAARPAPSERMDIDAFIAWRIANDVKHAELYNGRVVVAQAQTVRHSDRKAEVRNLLKAGVEKAGLPCRVLMEMLVPITDEFGYEPDVMIHCGGLDDSAVKVFDPVIVVEVVSPSSGRIDTIKKLPGYFSLPSVQHYLIVEPEDKFLVWHSRSESGAIRTEIMREGALSLDPPGLSVDAAAMIG